MKSILALLFAIACIGFLVYLYVNDKQKKSLENKSADDLLELVVEGKLPLHEIPKEKYQEVKQLYDKVCEQVQELK